MPYFVKVVFVELPHETGKVAVLEMFRKDMFRELLILLIVSAGHETGPNRGMLTSNTTKLSPSLPHRTTLVSEGFSNILQLSVLLRARRVTNKRNILVEFADLAKVSAA